MKFKLFGTEVFISFTLLCFAAISIILGVFSGFLWCVLAIIIHESGHLITMYILGYFPKRIKVSPFEISISDDSRQCRTEKENFLIIFFGPLANFICFVAFYLLYLTGRQAALPFAAANLSVGLFNILPVMSLDGGQLIYMLVCRRHSVQTAEKAVNVITFITVFPLSALGFVVLFHSKYNFSLLFVSVYLIFSLINRSNRYY